MSSDNLAAEATEQTLVRLDSRPERHDSDAVVCVVCVRNECLRLPYFLEYHRKLGVGSFFFVDNGSNDGTLQYLLDQEDVHVYSASGSYAASHSGVDWINQLLHAHARDRWALTLDADELLVYPDCEELKLSALTRYLDRHGEEALQTFILDMYSELPIRETIYQRGSDFLSACPFFDCDTYCERDDRGLPQRGGPRHRLFWAGRDNPKPSPFLPKFPLVKWDGHVRYEASTHVLSGRKRAAMTGALLHFKFFSDFYSKAAIEADRGEHWDEASQYKTYWGVFRENPALSAFNGRSVRYSGSSQLGQLGLIIPPSDSSCIS